MRVWCQVFDGQHASPLRRFEITPSLARQSDWSADYRLAVRASDEHIERITLSIEIKGEIAWHLSHNRQLRRIKKLATPPFPAGRFVVVQEGHHFYQYVFPWGAVFQIVPSSQGCEVRIVLRDHWRCGLTFWGSQKLSAAPCNYELRVVRNRLQSLDECLWIEPYPRGARAALCLTDHADFDSVPKMELLTDLFAKNNFRFTKSVFPAYDSHPDKREPTMEDKPYRQLMGTLYANGSEIAFHGLSPRAEAPALEECKRRAALLSDFNPTTWIDHGSGSYLLSRSATLSGGVGLTDFLNDFGIKNYWSYMDLWNNPFHNLSSWQRRTDKDALDDLRLSLKIVRERGNKQRTYLFVHALRNLLSQNEINALRQNPRNPALWSKVIATRRQLRALSSGPMLLYNGDGTSCFTEQQSNPLWFFDTVLANHLSYQLQPRMIERLCQTSGLGLVHCYLGAVHSYMAGNCFISKGAKSSAATHAVHHSGVEGVSLDKRFVSNIEYIAQRQRQGDVVSLSFASLRRSLTAFTSSYLMRTKSGWVLKKTYTDQPVIAGNHRTIASLRCDKSTVEVRNDTGYLTPPTGEEIALILDAAPSPSTS